MKSTLNYFLFVILFTTLLSCNDDDTNSTIIDQPTVSQIAEGNILFGYIRSKQTQLINSEKEIIKKWTSEYPCMGTNKLSSQGTLLRHGITEKAQTTAFKTGGGIGGIIEEIDDNNDVVWSYTKDDNDGTLHHDFIELDSNTILATLWSIETFNGIDYWDEKIVKINKSTKTITWTWSAFNDGNLKPTDDTEDYLHFNSIDYKDGKILVSAFETNTVYEIDEASKTIINSYTGGGILKRQHDAQYLNNGNILLFNNLYSDSLSAVHEIDGNDNVVWTYKDDFLSPFISGCQRLDNGNTLIISGFQGTFIEINNQNEEVWRYKAENDEPNGVSRIFKARKYKTS